MECNQTQIEAYHDGELTAVERVRAETHLRECEPCRQTLEQLQRLSSLVANAPLAAMAHQAMDRLGGAWDVIRARALGERMAAQRAANERGILRVAGWFTAAAAALLLGGLLMLSRTTGTQTADLPQNPSTAWEPVAVMPPTESGEGTPQVIQIAQWIANDLSISDADLPSGLEQ
jgi:anti-sigma factor RsiW